MKTIKYFLLAAAAVVAVSCAKEIAPIQNENPTPEVELVPMTFTASYDAGEPDTKVAYEGGATVWKVGDKIMVISATGTATEFEATEVTNEGKSATFEGLTENANEYYAVYPASAYKGEPTDVKDGAKLYVNIAETQNAVAGSFDPNAIFCTASNNGSTFSFKQACAYLKFHLANPAGIKNVYLMVNGSDNIAGVGYLGVNEVGNPEHRFATSDSKLKKYNKITLKAPEGGFVANEDYIIAMRANSCPTGVTFYIEYEDGLKSRTTNVRIFPAQDPNDPEKVYGSKGKIRNLGQLDKNLEDFVLATPYDRYVFGLDIEVAGKTINKQTCGDATLISSTAQTINNNGVYFLNSETTTTLQPKDGHYLSLYVISNYSGKAALNIGGNVRWTKNGVIGLKNIAIADETASATMFQSNAESGSLLLDGCSIPTPKVAQFIYAGHNIAELAVCNCDIKLTAASKNLINGNSKTITHCIIENNIVYSPSDDIAIFKFVTNTPAITTFDFNKNTVANVYSSTTSNEDYNKVSAISTFNCSDNLFYLPNYSDSRYLYITKVIPTSLNQSNNYLHKTASTNSRMRVVYEGNPKVADIWVTTEKIASNVVGEVNLEKGIIVPTTSAGATR